MSCCTQYVGKYTTINGEIALGYSTLKEGAQTMIYFLEASPYTSVSEAEIAHEAYTFLITSANITRPANTTAYTAKDVVGATAAEITFSDAFQKAAGKGYITKIRVVSNQKDEVWKPKIHFFKSAPTSIADNAPMALLFSENAIRLGSIEMAALAKEDTTSTCAVSQWTAGRQDSNNLTQGILPVIAEDDSTRLYCFIETLDAFTPASAAQYFIEVTVENIEW